MQENKFIQIYLDLLTHPDFISASAKFRMVLITIMSRVVFKAQTMNDHGVNIALQPGQLMCTYRQLAEWANVSKNDVERAIIKFSSVQILRQEVRHKKAILTVLWGMNIGLHETRSETKLRQERDRNIYCIDGKYKTTTTTSPKSKKVVVVVSSKETKENAKKCKDWLDAERVKIRKLKVGTHTEEYSWGSDWNIPLKTYEALITKYGYEYFVEQINYMCKMQGQFELGKSKKNINNPEAYLRKACAENYALSKKGEFA